MFKIDPYLVNGQHEITILLVGAGGTGSLILTKLARLNEAMIKMDHPGLRVAVIDPDIVEEHNVGRQMFTSGDVNCYKADALVSKINHAFGYDWEAINKKYSPEYSCVNITICAVDNIPARKQILDGFYKGFGGNDNKKKFYLIDCGNARDYGQVIFSDHDKKLKNITDFAPDWDKQDTVEQQGPACSYLDSLLEQDLFINDWVSLYAVQLIKDLWFKKYLDHQGVFFNATEMETVKIKIDGSRKCEDSPHRRSSKHKERPQNA